MILGAGGIGQNVGLVLARLGVGKITFIDKDIYEASNLSRQLLGSVNDIGKRKVDVAVQNISFHALKADAVYVGHHLNALESWPSIVALASDSTVIFNCIDDSSSFDFAVNSLSKSVGIPLVQGQSAAWSYNAEFYSGVYNERCFACSENMKSSFCTESSSYNAIEKRMHDWLGSEESEDCSETRRVLRDWIQDRSTCNSAPGHTESSVIASALFEFLNQDIQFRISGEIARWIVECAAQRVLDGTGYSVEKDSSTNSLVLTKFRRFLQHYYDISMDLLMPGAVDYLTDLLFLPRPKGLPTRYFGSW